MGPEVGLVGIILLDTVYGLLTSGSAYPGPQVSSQTSMPQHRDQTTGWLARCTFHLPVVLHTSCAGHEGAARHENKNNHIHTLSWEG